MRRARLRACVEGVESAGEANITEMEPLPAPVPLWRHPEMRVGDKALNAILKGLSAAENTHQSKAGKIGQILDIIWKSQ